MSANAEDTRGGDGTAPVALGPPHRFLNAGCGSRFHEAWVNLDTRPAHPSVIGHDIRQGLPFSDGSFDAVYHSHVLEHLTPREGRQFLRECRRVLTVNGIVRVAVPDLEQIARLYLHAVERARDGDIMWQENYDWLMIELYDQTVREVSGGEHGAYLNRDVIPNVDFILMRQGMEAQQSIDGQRQRRAASRTDGSASPSGARPVHTTLRAIARRARHLLSSGISSSARRERRIARLLGGEYELLRLGRFRRSGEVHQWMYDEYSLGRALMEAGFASPRRVCASESRIAGWARFGLDAGPDGCAHKPDSIYMEAIKPVTAGGPSPHA